MVIHGHEIILSTGFELCQHPVKTLAAPDSEAIRVTDQFNQLCPDDLSCVHSERGGDDLGLALSLQGVVSGQDPLEFAVWRTKCKR